MKAVKGRRGIKLRLHSRSRRGRRNRSTRPLGKAPRSRAKSSHGAASRPSERRIFRRMRHSGMSSQTTAEKQFDEAQYQAAIKNFDLAVRYFQKQNYEKAKEILEKLAAGPFQEVADRARVHLRLCEQKLSRSAPAPKSAEDYYNLGVAELNARNLDTAVEHLNRAANMEPEKDHVRYALAAALALRGSTDAALEQLKAAIILRPGSRFQAREDEDFQALATDPRFRRLVSSKEPQAF